LPRKEIRRHHRVFAYPCPVSKENEKMPIALAFRNRQMMQAHVDPWDGPAVAVTKFWLKYHWFGMSTQKFLFLPFRI
jgi:hypothetical protein